MNKLTPADLFSLEQYAVQRSDFRRSAMAHKLRRKVHLGGHLTLFFEDRQTMHYQIQEILRVERIFEPEDIAEELAAYNALIPDGSNWKATLMLQYPNVDERRLRLQALVGIAERVYVEVTDRVYAIADEDLERDTEEKTSSVHFLRFEFSDEQSQAIQQGAEVRIGVDHPQMNHQTLLTAEQQKVLACDLAD